MKSNTGRYKGHEGEIKLKDGTVVKGRYHKYSASIFTSDKGVNYCHIDRSFKLGDRTYRRGGWCKITESEKYLKEIIKSVKKQKNELIPQHN